MSGIEPRSSSPYGLVIALCLWFRKESNRRWQVIYMVSNEAAPTAQQRRVICEDDYNVECFGDGRGLRYFTGYTEEKINTLNRDTLKQTCE
jgi:hypothetical protein